VDEDLRLYLYWVGWPVLALAAAIFAARATRGAMRRTLVLAAVAIVAIGALFLEHAIGSRQFAQACAAEAGGRILATASLPPEYFSADGNANFFDLSADMETRLRNSRFRLSRTEADAMAGLVPVKRIEIRLVDHATGTVLAQHVRLLGANRLPPLLSEGAYGPCPAEAEERRFFDTELKKAFQRER
jgi:hypothetical protein